MDGPHSELSVFDLPQLYTKPSFDALIAAITNLPLISTSSSVAGSELSQVARYLTAIVASGLEWISSSDDRDSLWEEASRSLSDLSGQTASGTRRRVFTIWPSTATSPAAEFTIYEPGVTEGKTGFRTWGSAARLARNLKQYRLDVDASSGQDSNSGPILELGSGTGLSGMAVATGLGTEVYCSDLPVIVPNLRRNICSNLDTIEGAGGKIKLAQLDWKAPSEMQVLRGDIRDESAIGGRATELESFETVNPESFKFSTVIASDCLYSTDNLDALVRTMSTWLERALHSRVMVETPCRPGFDDCIRTFDALMHSRGFQIELRVQEDPTGDDSPNQETSTDNERDQDGNIFPYLWTVWMWSHDALFP